MTTTVIITGSSGDCWANKNNDFSNTEDYLYVIDNPGVTNSNVKTWIPFVVNLRSVTIEQAYITVTVYANSVAGEGDINLSCEDADNPSAPTAGSDLNGRTLTDFTATASVGTGWTALETFTWQMDNPIQEVLSRPGWQPGNTLAVVIWENDIGDGTRQIYSSRGVGGIYRAKLTLNIADEPSDIDFT